MHARSESAIPTPHGAPSRPAARRTVAAVFALLCLGTFLVFLPLRHAEFLNYDDDAHVTANPQVQAGLTWDGLVWAATNIRKWIPLTWLSHMLDCQLFGLDAGAHHLSGVVLHVANSALLLYVLLRLTGALWPSAFVAALFALHPLHVEPVAWISSRPHLVSTWFWLAALLAYVRYTEQRTWRRYLAVALCMMLSLLGKGMVVTLPITLLLLDYWPLRRWPVAPGQPSTWRLLAEKLPLVLIALVDTVIQLIEQQLAWALAPLDTLPFARRLANTIVAYAGYVVQMLWPVNLALPYPLHPAFPPAWQIAGSLAGLIVLTAVVARRGREHRYLVTGWLWYLITLLPVIGVVQIGVQAMADRYTYIPLIGLFVAIAWGAAEAARHHPRVQATLPIAAAVVILSCAGLTRHQIGYWRDDVTLFRHTLEVTTDNPVAENNLGLALRTAGRRDEARAHFEAAVRIDPANPEIQNNMGIALAESGQLGEAEKHFREAVRLWPDFPSARLNLGAAWLRLGNPAGAREQFEMAIRLQPWNPLAHLNLARALEAEGHREEARAAYDLAIRQYRADLRLNPAQAAAENSLGEALQAIGQREEARTHFAEAIRLNAACLEAQYNMGVLVSEDGHPAAAESYFRAAGPLGRNDVMARINAGAARLQAGDPAGAREEFTRALEIDPQKPAAHLGLAQAFEAEGRLAEALAAYARTTQLDPNLHGVHFRFAKALHAAGRLAEAIEQYQAELRLDPAHSEAENNLAAALQAVGRRDEARAHFAAALRIDPANPEAHNNLGVLLFEDGQFAAAEAAFREALRLRPHYTSAQLHLGYARLQQGDAADAIEQFRAVLRVTPANEQALAALSQLGAVAP